MKRSEIIKRLIGEGFIQNTLMNLPDKQLNVLAKRILGEGIINIPKDSNPADIENLRREKKTFETYEQETVDGSSESLVEEALDLYRQLYEGKDTLSYEEKRDLNIRIMELRTKLTPEQEQEFKNGRESIKSNEINSEEEQIGEEEVETKEASRTFAMGRRGLLSKKVDYAGKDCQTPHYEKKKRKKRKKGKGKRKNRNESKVAKLLEAYTKGKQKEWVKKLVENKYHQSTTKNEILEMVKFKLTEQEVTKESGKLRWTKKLQTIFNRLYNANLPVDGNWMDEKYNQYKKKYYEDNDILVYVCKEGDTFCDPGEITTRGRKSVEKLNMVVDRDYRNNNTKLYEQEPAIKEPKVKPKTRPNREVTPEKTPYPNPWQPPEPNKLPDPTPKFKNELPDWLTYDAIIQAVGNNNVVENTTSKILKKIQEQAFNKDGEPLMTHSQYRDYSEPSEPEYDDREPDHFDDSPKAYLEYELEGHDILLEPEGEDEYSIRNKGDVDFMVWFDRGRIHVDIGNGVEDNKQVFDDEEKALKYILKFKKIFLSADESQKEREQEMNIDMRDSHNNKMERSAGNSGY